MKKIALFVFAGIIGLSVSSCEIANVLSSAESTVTTLANEIASASDSVKTGKRHKHFTVDIATLPAAIPAYVAANYAGFAITSAHTHDSLSTTANIDVVIKKDTSNKVLVFTSTGTFVKEKAKGSKGKFNKTPIDVATLPAAITSYIGTNYSGATIAKAFTDVNSSTYVIVTLADGSAKAVVFDATNAFVEEKTKPGKGRGKGRG